MSEVSNSSAESNACGIDRITDLHLAIIYNNVTKVEQLLSEGADVNAISDDVGMPLQTVAYYSGENKSHIELVEILLKNGADVNGKDKYGGSPLHAVALSNENESLYEFAEMLLKNGADVNARNCRGETPLHRLVMSGNVKIVELFLNYKADLNAVDDVGDTLLFLASYNTESTEVLQLLIDLGLDVNHRRSDGETPLHRVCCLDGCYNNIKAMKCLLKNGADMSAINHEKHTPLGRFILFYIESDEEPIVEKDVKFILEHANWNVPEEVNFLDSPHLVDYDDLWEVILRHFAKLEVLNIAVNPAFLNAISKQSSYDDYYKECKEELLRAKKTKLKNTWITFYNLLMDSRKALKNYAGNKDLIKNFKKSKCNKKFPIYGVQMCENVEKGIKRRGVFDKSTDLLSNCLPIYNPTHLIIKDILDCILSKKDLEKFCE